MLISEEICFLHNNTGYANVLNLKLFSAERILELFPRSYISYDQTFNRCHLKILKTSIAV